VWLPLTDPAFLLVSVYGGAASDAHSSVWTGSRKYTAESDANVNPGFRRERGNG